MPASLEQEPGFGRGLINRQHGYAVLYSCGTASSGPLRHTHNQRHEIGNSGCCDTGARASMYRQKKAGLPLEETSCAAIVDKKTPQISSEHTGTDCLIDSFIQRGDMTDGPVLLTRENRTLSPPHAPHCTHCTTHIKPQKPHTHTHTTNPHAPLDIPLTQNQTDVKTI